MAKVKLIRPAPYNYRVKDYDLYESYDLVARGKVKPQIDAGAITDEIIKIAQGSTVISSSLPRAQSTAQAIKRYYRVSNDFNEIRYTMKEVLPRDEFNQRTSTAATNEARKLFFIKLFESKLSENYEQLYTRTIRALQLLANIQKDILVISHGFFLKFLEIAVIQPEAITNFHHFSRLYDGSDKTFGFLDGPTFSSEDIRQALNSLNKAERLL